MNANNPSSGAVVVQKGGKTIYRDVWIAYGMTIPPPTATPQSISGKVRVRNTFTAAKGGVWTALPIVKRAGSAVYNLDDTVTETI